MAKQQFTQEEVATVKRLHQEIGNIDAKRQQEEIAMKDDPMHKPWDELTMEEKIERTRINVKSVDQIVASFQNSVNSLRNEVEALFDHSHEENGQVVIKITKNERYKLRNQMNGLNEMAQAAKPLQSGMGNKWF